MIKGLDAESSDCSFLKTEHAEPEGNMLRVPSSDFPGIACAMQRGL